MYGQTAHAIGCWPRSHPVAGATGQRKTRKRTVAAATGVVIQRSFAGVDSSGSSLIEMVVSQQICVSCGNLTIL